MIFDQVVSDKIFRLYKIFEQYTFPGRYFCTFCYTEEEIKYFTKTPVELIALEPARELLWAPSDHWESAGVYRHYLPRLLEFYGDPWFLDDLYPSHLFEILTSLGFHQWPNDEQHVVIDYLEFQRRTFKQRLKIFEYDEWKDGLESLKSVRESS